MPQYGQTWVQGYGYKPTKICDQCSCPQHISHVGNWGPGPKLTDYWFCQTSCARDAAYRVLPARNSR
jgi:hypothetical protein